MALHVREGAFPPSVASSESPVLPITSPGPSSPDAAKAPAPAQRSPTPTTADLPPAAASPPVPAAELESRPALDVPRARGPLGLHTREPSTLSDTTSHSSADALPASLSRVTSRGEADAAGQLGVAASRTVRSVLTNWKRFSALPRPPSMGSLARSGSSSRHSARSVRLSPAPSPSALPPIPVAPPKIRSHWPKAMQFDDITARRTALDRAMGYAQKINELAMYECGLGEWVVTTKTRGEFHDPDRRLSER